MGGHDATESVADPKPAPRPKKRRKKHVFAVCALLVFSSLIGLFGYHLVQRHRKFVRQYEFPTRLGDYAQPTFLRMWWSLSSDHPDYARFFLQYPDLQIDFDESSVDWADSSLLVRVRYTNTGAVKRLLPPTATRAWWVDVDGHPEIRAVAVKVEVGENNVEALIPAPTSYTAYLDPNDSIELEYDLPLCTTEDQECSPPQIVCISAYFGTAYEIWLFPRSDFQPLAIEYLFTPSLVDQSGSNFRSTMALPTEQFEVDGHVVLTKMFETPKPFLLTLWEDFGQYGRRRPRPLVTIDDSYSISATEVTIGLWNSVMADCCFRAGRDDQLPVTHVSFDMVQMFCSRLGKKIGRTVRLPTSKEWEFAASAGLPWTATFDFSNRLNAWTSETSNGMPHPVGQLKPNPAGIYDMLGNVAELCDYSLDPEPRREGDNRDLPPLVVRGGSYREVSAQIAERVLKDAGKPQEDVGFRIVVE